VFGKRLLFQHRATGKQLTNASCLCASPPPLHCPAANCPRELIANRGNAVLPKSNRFFFIDYPCDLKPHESVTFVLNLPRPRLCAGSLTTSFSSA